MCWSVTLQLCLWEKRIKLSDWYRVFDVKECDLERLFFKVNILRKYRYFLFFFLNRYTSVYNPYKYLISVETENKVKKFISKDRPLREYRHEIEKLKKLIDAVGSLPVTIPMHLFYLDCNHINQVGLGLWVLLLWFTFAVVIKIIVYCKICL